MIGAALAIGLRFGGALLEFATSRIGLPICVAVVTYLYAHHAGVVEERNRNALAVQSALLKQQDADAASRQQIAKDNAIRFNASQARVRMLQTQVEKYAAELKTRLRLLFAIPLIATLSGCLGSRRPIAAERDIPSADAELRAQVPPPVLNKSKSMQQIAAEALAQLDVANDKIDRRNQFEDDVRQKFGRTGQ